MAIEFIEGESLADHIIRSGGRLPPTEAANIVLQAARGLAHAHGCGLLHRDIKPGNIMMLPDGKVQIVDFGVAKLIDVDAESEQKLTQTNSVVGTPYYMSPEQCEKAPLDARSDMYALGCVLYEMLSGHPPFEGDSPLEVMFNHIHSEPPALPCDVPEWLNALTMRMLAKDRNARLEDMEAVQAVIQRSAPAPKMVARKKQTITRKRLTIPMVALLIVAGTGVIAYYVAGTANESRIREIRHRYSEELGKAKQAELSYVDLGNIQWREANELGYPDGTPEATESMEKLHSQFVFKAGYGDAVFCNLLIERIPQYVSKFHDHSFRWHDLLMKAIRTSFSWSLKNKQTADAQRLAARWMELTPKDDAFDYVCSLGARILSGELTGDRMAKMVAAAKPQLGAAYGTTPAAQVELGGYMNTISDAMYKHGHNTSNEIVWDEIRGFDKVFGTRNSASAQAKLTIAARLMGEKHADEAKRLYEEVLPILSESPSPPDVQCTIQAARMLRDAFPGTVSKSQAESLTKLLCEKQEELLAKGDAKQVTREETVDRYCELADILVEKKRLPVALKAALRAQELAATLPQSSPRVLRNYARISRIYGALKLYPQQEKAFESGIKIVDKYHADSQDAMILFLEKAIYLAINGNPEQGVKLFEARVRPAYVRLLSRKEPGLSKENLSLNDKMVAEWRTWYKPKSE